MPLKKFVPASVATVDMSMVALTETSMAVPETLKAPETTLKYTGARKRDTADDDKMTKADWAAKDRRISRAGVYQAALQSVGVVQYNVEGTLEGYLKAVRIAAEDGLKFINEVE